MPFSLASAMISSAVFAAFALVNNSLFSSMFVSPHDLRLFRCPSPQTNFACQYLAALIPDAVHAVPTPWIVGKTSRTAQFAVAHDNTPRAAARADIVRAIAVCHTCFIIGGTAAAAGDVIQLVVAQLARLRVEQVKIRLGLRLGQLHAVFLGERQQLLGSFRFLCLRKQFLVEFHRFSFYIFWFSSLLRCRSPAYFPLRFFGLRHLSGAPSVSYPVQLAWSQCLHRQQVPIRPKAVGLVSSSKKPHRYPAVVRRYPPFVWQPPPATLSSSSSLSSPVFG